VVQRRKRLLDIDKILDGALVVIDKQGRLTMADLAAQLGASASSVYHHVSGRAAIVEMLRERVVVAAMAVPSLEGTDWVDQVAGWMHSYRRALAQHPNLIPLLTEHTMTGGSVLRSYDRIATILLRAGVPAHEVLLWISVFDCYALGAALDLAAPDDVWRGEEVGELQALNQAIGAAPRGRRRADEAFEIGLDALLAGLRQRLGRS
jgi:AcrR family transcriptional regulator